MRDDVISSNEQFWPPVETKQLRYEVRLTGKSNQMYGVWDNKKEDLASVGGTPFISYLFGPVANVCALWNLHHSED